MKNPKGLIDESSILLDAYVLATYVRLVEYKHNLCVPAEVSQIIEDYVETLLAQMTESFTLHGLDIRLSARNTVATIKPVWQYGSRSHKTVYGNNVINVNNRHIRRYKWTLQIRRSGTNVMAIGIDSSPDNAQRLYRGFFENNKHKHYGFKTNGFLCNWNGHKNERLRGVNDIRYGVLTLVLDVVDQTLVCQIDGKWYLIAKEISRRRKKYNLAISMYDGSDSVELLAFETATLESDNIRTDFDLEDDDSDVYDSDGWN